MLLTDLRIVNMASSLDRNKSFGSSYDLILEGWEVKENQDGVVYFVNNQLKVTSWIHPYVNKVLEGLGNFNDVKYAAYRTALKLRFLQTKLGFSWISIKAIKTIFSRIPVKEECSGVEDVLSCRDAFSILHSVLEISDSLHLHKNHLIQVSEIILNLLLELYDTTHSGKIAKRSIRVALVVLCSGTLSDKYRSFFDEITNDQGTIQREKFLFLIYDIMQITEFLKESTAFGTNVSAAVNSCLHRSNESQSESFKDKFFSWLLQEPQTLIWLPTLHRLIATENVRHNVQCSVCNMHPLVGFRYRCMQCLSYDLCQSCFFRGCFSQSHRLKHPMKEYCLPPTKKDNTKALLRIVRNKMSKRHRQSKITFLPVDDDSITGSVFQWQPRNLIPDPRDSFYGSTDSGLAVGSANADHHNFDLADDINEEDIAMMKKWFKPVDVLGEPCETSSPFWQQGTLSKKNMENQQFRMTQTIQQLEDENRILRQKLSALRKRDYDYDDEEEEIQISEDDANILVKNRNDSIDPLKEITTDEPISPINFTSNLEAPLPNINAFAIQKEFIARNQDVSLDVLQIVGSCTPISSSFFFTENKASTDSNESGINEGESNSDEFSMSSRKSMIAGEVNFAQAEAQYYKQEIQENSNVPFRSQPIFALKVYSDTDTESTAASNDLEYTLSDMSLTSEAPSVARSMYSEQSDLRSTEQIIDNVQLVDEFKQSDSISARALPYYDTLSYATPNTTRNGTLDTDDFRLNRMKFDKSLGICDKLSRNSSGSGSRPHLIYASSSKGSNCSSRIGYQDLKPDSCHINKLGMVSKTNSFSSHVHASNYASFDLSEIPTQGSVTSFSKGVSSRPHDLGPRKAPEPVFMSTPMTNENNLMSNRSTALRKKSASAKAYRKKREKENKAPLESNAGSSSSSVKEEPYGMTPKSAIPHWQRQRILRSMDRLLSNRSYSCNDLTTEGEMGMTTMFDKAEHHRTVGAGSSSLALEDKEELNKLVAQIGIDDTQWSNLPTCIDKSNTSMLQAVLNIADAMADFVQATADVQIQKESTHF